MSYRSVNFLGTRPERNKLCLLLFCGFLKKRTGQHDSSLLGFDQYLLGKVWSPYLYNIFQILNHKTCEFTQTLWNHTKALYIIEMERNINWRTPSGGLENKRMRLRIYLKNRGNGKLQSISSFFTVLYRKQSVYVFHQKGLWYNGSTSVW